MWWSVNDFQTWWVPEVLNLLAVRHLTCHGQMLGILPASSTTSEWLLGASMVSSFLRWSSGLVTFSWSTSWFLLNLPHGNLTAKAKLRHHYLMSESDWELGAPVPYWQQGCPTCNPMQNSCEGPAAITSLHFSSELPSCWPDRALSVTSSFVASKVLSVHLLLFFTTRSVSNLLEHGFCSQKQSLDL